MPNDILRKLPVAKDWDQVADVARKNQELRDKVNAYIAHIWAKKTKREKTKLKAQAMSSKAAFETLLAIIHEVPPKAYDVANDPDGLISWARLSQELAQKFPLIITGVKTVLDLESAYQIVKKIISQFKQLIENNGINKELYRNDGFPRHESTAQRLFFAIAYSYCKANDLDISPEVDTGTGKIDFKFSTGFESRILVEVKLSTNQNVVKGYINQLEVYKKSEETMKAFYLIMDVGGMGKKDEKLYVLRNRASSEGYALSDIEFVDAKLKPSASKRK